MEVRASQNVRLDRGTPRLNRNSSSVIILVIFNILGFPFATLEGGGALHVMLVPAMVQHIPGEHMNIIATEPPTEQDAPEVHPDVIVDGPVRGTGIPTEGAVGVVHLGSCLVSVNIEGLLGSNPGHGSRVNDSVKPDVLLFAVAGMIGVDLVPITVHQTPDSQRRSVFLMTGHPIHHGEHGFEQLLGIFQTQRFLLSFLGDFLQESVFSKEVPLFAGSPA